MAAPAAYDERPSMPSYDDSIIAAMGASEREVMRVGENAIGTEHVLIGLLATGGSVAAEVQRAGPGLTAESVRAALQQGIDDLPHLQRLGIDPQRVLASAGTPLPGPLWRRAATTRRSSSGRCSQRR